MHSEDHLKGSFHRSSVPFMHSHCKIGVGQTPADKQSGLSFQDIHTIGKKIQCNSKCNLDLSSFTFLYLTIIYYLIMLFNMASVYFVQ